MSKYKFTIIDYSVNPAGDSTVIPEPVGWDGLIIKLQRSPEYHGFFDYFDNSISGLQFDGEGFDIIKSAYSVLGSAAKLELEIEYACSETDSFEPLYTGRFDFNTYSETCGDRCFIEINIETTSCLVDFKNRSDQKVDLESLRSFDLPDGDPDDLTAYAGLGFDIELLANAVFLRTFYQMTDGNIFYFTDGVGALLGEAATHYYTFALDKPVETTLPSFAGITFAYDVLNGTPPSPLENFITNGFPIFTLSELSALACYGDFNISAHVKGNFIEDTNSDRNYGSSWVLIHVDTGGTITVLDTQTIDAGTAYAGGVPHNQLFDKTLTATVSLVEGDKIYVALLLFNYQYDTAPDPYTLSVEFEIYDFDINGLTQCDPTESKVFLVNETASRIVESITNDCLRVYSDYFGRVDALPYTSASDGCGSWEILTNGLNIRRAVMVDDTDPKTVLSFAELWAGLNPIHNLGLGVEVDPNRADHELLRLEKVQYFYDDAVIFTINDIKDLKRSILPSEIYSTFNGGFQKYETETAGGRNDIHAKRNFRTTISNIKNALEQVSSFIASGHSIEVTRWQVGATSQDWRYDNDTFVVCVVRDEGALGGWRVERGESMPTADNLPNWETCYNVLISPQRNARRWTPIILQAYVDFLNGTIKFMDGTGNIIASTFILPNTSTDCITQDDAIPFVNMPENADISLSASAAYPFDPDNIENFYPFKKPERVRFEYPLSFEDWKTIKANPRGLIAYNCGDGVLEQGWIEEINYKINDGIAEFILIPRIDVDQIGVYYYG
jgi:hypothetical protein